MKWFTAQDWLVTPIHPYIIWGGETSYHHHFHCCPPPLSHPLKPMVMLSRIVVNESSLAHGEGRGGGEHIVSDIYIAADRVIWPTANSRLTTAGVVSSQPLTLCYDLWLSPPLTDRPSLEKSKRVSSSFIKSKNSQRAISSFQSN